MTNEEIMTRCRKVAIKIEDNRIFGDQNAPYECVTAFRNKQLAENNLKANQGMITTSSIKKPTICEFYLVPASRIDTIPSENQ